MKNIEFANQSEVPTKQYFSVSFLINWKKVKVFMFLFAATDIKFNILRTPLFENYRQNIYVEEFTMNFKHSFIDQTTIFSLSTLIEKFFHFYSLF